MFTLNDIVESTNFILNRANGRADFAIILGTGLAEFMDYVEVKASLPFSHIPHFPVSTAPTHVGNLALVRLNEQNLWILNGRTHYYEGYSMHEITYPIRVLNQLGVKNLIITNASGGLNETFESSDIVQVEDHINLMPENPLRGLHPSLVQNRFVDLLHAYDIDLRKRGKQLAQELQINLKKGVYVAVPGPSMETQAEYEYFRMIGGDIVGMSSVPEVIVARQYEMKVALFSIVSNMGYPHPKSPLNLTKIIGNVQKAVPQLAQLLVGLLNG